MAGKGEKEQGVLTPISWEEYYSLQNRLGGCDIAHGAGSRLFDEETLYKLMCLRWQGVDVKKKISVEEKEEEKDQPEECSAAAEVARQKGFTEESKDMEASFTSSVTAGQLSPGR